MRTHTLNTFTKGWFIGNFEPSIIKTKACECAVKYYKKGDSEKKHVHKQADEITVVVSGLFQMNDNVVHAGDIVLIEKNEVTDFTCLEDGATCVLKIPSVLEDKFFV